MSINLNDFITPAGRAQLREQRIEAYIDEAQAYYTQNFQILARTLSGEEQRAVIRQAYNQSCKRDFETPREHMMYLAAVATWGLYFDNNPLYHDELNTIGWFPVPDKPHKHSPFGLFTAAQNTPFCLYRANPNSQRATRVFAVIYGNPKLQGTRAEVEHHTHNIWPERMKATPPETAKRFVTAVMENAEQLGLKGQDVVGHACISYLLGIGFYVDPQFPWAVTAYAEHIQDPPRLRAALSQGFMQAAQKLQGEAP